MSGSNRLKKVSLVYLIIVLSLQLSKAQENIHFFQPSIEASLRGSQVIGDSIIRVFGISHDRRNPFEGGAFFTDLHTSDPLIHPDLNWISDSLGVYTFAVKDFYSILLDSGFALLVFEHIDCDFSGTPVICLLNPSGTLEWIQPLENIESAEDIQNVYRVDKDLIKIVTEFQSIYFDLEGNFVPATSVHLTYDSLIVYSNGYLGLLSNQYIVLDHQFNALKNLGEISGFRFFDVVLRDHYLLARPDSFFLLDKNFNIIHNIKGWAPFGSVVSVNNRILTISSAFFQITIFDSTLQIIDSYFYPPTYIIYGGENMDGHLFFYGVNRGIHHNQLGIFLSFTDTASTNLIPEYEDAEFTSIKLPMTITYDTSEYAINKDGYDMMVDSFVIEVTNFGQDTLHSIFINFLADIPCDHCTRKFERWSIDSLNIPYGENKFIHLGSLILDCVNINIGELCFWISSPNHHTDRYQSNDYLCQSIQMVTSVADYHWEYALKVFPNPAHDYIQIENPFRVKFSGRIMNSVGQVVRKIMISDENSEFPLNGLQGGIYFLNIFDEMNGFISKKFTVR